MLRQYTVSKELQQFLAGLGSRAVANVVLDTSYTSDSPALPSNPTTAVRRSLFFSQLDRTSATPTEFDAFVENLDGTAVHQLTVPR